MNGYEGRCPDCGRWVGHYEVHHCYPSPYDERRQPWNKGYVHPYSPPHPYDRIADPEPPGPGTWRFVLEKVPIKVEALRSEDV